MEICRICGETGDFSRYRVREMMYGLRDEFLYFQCTTCGCLQIRQVPADMKRFYPENYRAFRQLIPPSGFRRLLIRSRNRFAVWGRSQAGRLLHLLYPYPALRSLAYIRPRKDWRVLDVGCGSGELLMALGGIGFSDLTGVDLYLDKPGTVPGGARLIQGTVAELEGEWDLIMFHHSFEHVPDPHETLAHVSGLLQPGGWCLIRIPTVSSLAWEHFRENWVQLDAPRHFFLYSVDSVRFLTDRAGLQLDHIRYDSASFQFWASEQYAQDLPLRTGDPKPALRTFSRRELRRFERRARRLNRQGRGDQAVFYLRKPEQPRKASNRISEM